MLLHGVGMSGDCFIRNIDALASRFTVYAPDMIGHGFTAAAEFGCVPAQLAMARHVVAMAESLGFDLYAVGGFSFGALVAGLAYFETTEKVEKLILVGSGSVFHPGEEQRDTLRAAAANGVKAMTDPTLESCSARGYIVYDPASVPEELVYLQLTSYALHDRLEAYSATIESAIAHMDNPSSRILDRFEQIACPTKVIVGRDDIRADWRWHEKGAARLPACEFTIYERCGHMPFLEHADRFNEELTAFLASAEPGGAKAA